MSRLAPLPVDEVVPSIADELRRGTSLILSAPPGSGKTTRVPPALAEALDGAVLVLEPRRIAARAAARRVAAERGLALGDAVGYEVRDERRVAAHTPLRYMTEGVLVRRLLDDPALDGVAAVVLDEFHERHLDTDLALAMLAEVRATVRPELRLVVMSATLDVAPLRAYLEPCALVAAEGTLHEVRVEQLDPRPGSSFEQHVRAGVVRALEATRGDVLVFLPGMAEIRRVTRELGDLAVRRDLAVLPLHGALGSADQDRALEPLAQRKVVLATNVAESSLTIEGVSAVVDSGLARVLRHDPGRGLDALRIERISRASAAQRAGRAGRTGPGVCFRLWSRAEERGQPEFDTPEIRRVDLASAALLVRGFASRDPRDLDWFDAPDDAALARADELLRALGLVGRDGRVTADGARALRLPLHPRLGRMLCEAERRGVVGAAAEVAAILGERELRRGGGADLHDLVEVFREVEHARFAASVCSRRGVDGGVARSVARLRARTLRVLARRKPRVRTSDPGDADRALAYAVLAGYADRVARLREGGIGQLVGGRGVLLRDAAFADTELVVALRVEDRDGAARSSVRLALPIEREWLEEVVPGSVTVERGAEMDAVRGQVVAVTRVRYLDLVLTESRGGPADPDAVEALLADAVRSDPFACLGEQRGLRRFLERVAWLRAAAPELGLPELGPAEVGDATAQLVAGKRALRELRGAPVQSVLEAELSKEQRDRLRRDAPERLRLANGRQLRIEYVPEPRVAARLQEFFGLRETPRIGGGKVALVLELLAPNRRAVQVTRDLASFWSNVYPNVRSELRRRYPKHAWPEDPLAAKPG